ncbi:hydrogenase maturation nickel metallochaperone HypA/HybF [Robertkochia aurantiaca]|uniref:hydrogenase maturation nickel metallochaperone HypA/HybF n=1 Tax=Robertkochia aurantiaca TaxID=2873700 RepID=UPI001CCF09D8|nr:hydrogenase maturation nickel metallochaperone HypA [Robertkochia sp. 3YJGBD-33]
MHELSVAMGIVRIAEAELRNSGAGKIDKIELQIGTLAGIEFEALDFVWPMAVRNTVLEGAERELEIITACGKCLECDHEYEMQKLYDPCPLCRSNLRGIIRGRELRVKALEVT